jgi:hypothetical protein
LPLLLLAVLSLPLPGFGFDALAHGMAGKDAISWRIRREPKSCRSSIGRQAHGDRL